MYRALLLAAAAAACTPQTADLELRRADESTSAAGNSTDCTTSAEEIEIDYGPPCSPLCIGPEIMIFFTAVAVLILLWRRCRPPPPPPPEEPELEKGSGAMKAVAIVSAKNAAAKFKAHATQAKIAGAA